MRKASLLLFFCMALLMANAGSAFAGTTSTTLSKTVSELLGTPYKWAGTTTSGFDCSGFTQYVFGQLNIGVDLPHQSAGQAKLGTKVEKSELREGDLVFFNTSGSGISHVGIYMGGGKFAHSATNEGVVINELSEKYYANRYVTAVRIFSDKTYEIHASVAAAKERAAEVEIASAAK